MCELGLFQSQPLARLRTWGSSNNAVQAARGALGQPWMEFLDSPTWTQPGFWCENKPHRRNKADQCGISVELLLLSLALFPLSLLFSVPVYNWCLT